jgi:hypothetical protein
MSKVSTKASVFSFQSSSVQWAELDTPKADRYAVHDNTPFCQQVFNISMTKIEPMVKPDRVTDDIGWEPKAFICIHRQSL